MYQMWFKKPVFFAMVSIVRVSLCLCCAAEWHPPGCCLTQQQPGPDLTWVCLALKNVCSSHSCLRICRILLPLSLQQSKNVDLSFRFPCKVYVVLGFGKLNAGICYFDSEYHYDHLQFSCPHR